jgi:hypothetical protein
VTTTNIFHGPVTNVTTTGDNATVNVTVNASDLQAMGEFIARVEAALGELTLPVPQAVELHNEIKALKAEAQTSAPRKGVLKGGIEKVLGLLKSVGSSVAAKSLADMGTEALKHLMHNPPI